MKNRCWSCKKWEQHFYWDHFQESNYRFVKVMNGDFTHKMATPIKFVKECIRQKPHGITVFCSESKKRWYVSCSRRSSSWGFCGKSLFKLLQENMIQKGDACVFQLKENRKDVVMEMRIVRAEEVCSILEESYF
ncbi:B3 domain-containing protein Os12g0592300-like [Phalaenopsis equestris]|uniref:B3 domain-containing protein Os12g0592300-like n=1 Tax=Phalaenopsis equestris TaxID=78828 RepID=UPI0009E3544C|nr:B3 domain-containing protein Os12g0592300-like [Phalaenopsis equestris]